MMEGVALMINVLLLPDASVLALLDITVDSSAKTITAVAATTSPQASCPVCHQPSSKVQSRYVRTLADLPCSGQQVRWLVRVRRFWCLNAGCPRKIFSERLPTCAPAYARRTTRQAESLHELAVTAGGKSGQYLARRQGMPASRDTLLRLTRRRQLAAAPTPRVLGVDDFAWKKRHRYGTILVDLEKHQVVDVLPDREAETLITWLREHPQVEIITRDRSGSYADAARRGAPQATQVSDRFHLLVNLQSALIRLFDRKHDLLKVVAAEEHALREPHAQAALATASPRSAEPKPLPLKEVQRQARRTRRQTRYEEVLKLHTQGASQRAIASRLGLHRETVRRYLAAPAFPEIVRPKRKSKLDPYKDYLHQRWAAGQHNITHLVSEIRARGYRGSATIVHGYLRPYRQHPEWLQMRQHDIQQGARSGDPTPLSAREAAWLFVCNPRKLTLRQVWQLEPLRLHDEGLARAYHLTQDFRTMVVQRQVAVLHRWLQEAQQSGIAELRSFAAGIYRDYDAVRAALSSEYSNGQTEGQVNRLKLIKRQAYGRAHFDLLRLRVLHRSESTNQQK
jgi:transposase